MMERESGLQAAPSASSLPQPPRSTKQGSEPRHAMVADYVRERIYSKEWGVDQPIPSEHELSQMLGLARGTVKKGIRTLVDEGLLVQQRGRGTYVTKPVMARSASGHLLSFAEAMGEQGIDHQTDVVVYEVRQASELCAYKLGIAEGEAFLYLERVRTVAGQPVMYIESHLNLQVCPGLDTADFAQESVFAAIERTSGQAIGRSEVAYSARVAGKRRGHLLACDEHAPVLQMEQLVHLADGTPVEWGSVWLPANRCVIKGEASR